MIDISFNLYIIQTYMYIQYTWIQILDSIFYIQFYIQF